MSSINDKIKPNFEKEEMKSDELESQGIHQILSRNSDLFQQYKSGLHDSLYLMELMNIETFRGSVEIKDKTIEFYCKITKC